MSDPRFSLLVDGVRARYDNGDPSHDFAHVERVMRTCARLCEACGADASVVLPAALLHDVINVPKDHPDRADASRRAAELARGILAAHGYSQAEVARIAVAIVEHSYSRGLSPSSLESAVLQDADRLDALGAIGLMRTVTCGGRMGSRYYAEIEPVPRTRALDDKAFTLDHLFVKLFKLEAGMHTAAARQEAAARTAFMRRFLDQLQKEIM